MEGQKRQNQGVKIGKSIWKKWWFWTLIFFMVLGFVWIKQGGVAEQLFYDKSPSEVVNDKDAGIKNKNLKNMNYLINIKTNLGEIVFTTYDADAPKAVANFIKLAEKGFYDGVIFHRVINGFMIQGGDPTGTGRGGPGYTFEDELNPETESYRAGYQKGVVAMANSGPDTNGSQFFIMVADYSLPNNYTIFGKIVSGQEVADKIAKLPTDENDRPLEPPVIERVDIEKKEQ